MVSVLSSALAHTILYSPWVIYFLCIALDKSFEELFYFWEAAMDNVLLLIFGIFFVGARHLEYQREYQHHTFL